jgi:hypothetical protein
MRARAVERDRLLLRGGAQLVADVGHGTSSLLVVVVYRHQFLERLAEDCLDTGRKELCAFMHRLSYSTSRSVRKLD